MVSNVRAPLAVATVVLVWGIAWLALIASAAAPAAPRSVIAVAAAFDFVATAGLALYLIAVRAGRLPRWTLGVTLAIGLAMAKVALARTSDPAHAVTALLMALELSMVVLLVVRGRRARAAWRVARAAGDATFEALTTALVAARFPARLAAMMATEAVVFGGLVTGWRRPASSPSVFTVHRANGWPLYAGVLIFLTLVETVAFHVVLSAYVSVILAWVVTASSIYTALWIAGDVLVLRHSGVVLRDAGLELRIGIRWRGRVPWADVVSIDPVDATPADAINASILGANVVLRLRAPCALVGLFGRRRAGTAIALSLDDREAFVSAARARCPGMDERRGMS